MREALEQSQVEMRRVRAEHGAVCEALNKRLALLQGEVDHVRDCGAALVNSRVFPPEKVVRQTFWPRQWDATPREGAYTPFGAEEATRLVRADIVDLYEFGFTIEKNRHPTALLVHFFCEGYGELANQWRYMISPQALLKTGLSHEARVRFATSIGAQLVAAAEDQCRRGHAPSAILPPSPPVEWRGHE